VGSGETEGAGGLIGDLLGAARRNLGMDVAFVAEFTGGRRVFRFVDADEADDGLLVPGEGDPLDATYCKRIVDGVLPEVIPDTSLESLALELPGTAAIPVGSHVGVPITFPDGRLYGTLCCFSHQPAELDERDGLALALVADVVAAQLQRVEEHLRESVVSRDLVEAVLEASSFHPVFQAIVDLASGRVVGVEALTRFTAEPAQGPDKWFALAHVTGLGVELELATLAAALEQIGDLPARAYLSVNVSPAVLPDAVPLLSTVDGTRLVVEITEHDEVADYDALLGTLAGLRARGIRVAIDDAGAGYSSLSHVLRLLPDIVKIDMSITQGVDGDLARQALARALVEFGGRLGATVVAEGIETTAELQVLASIGVACGQGYLMARPGPLPVPDTVDLGPIDVPEAAPVAPDAVHYAFNAAPIALVVLTPDGRFVEVNELAMQLFQRDRADLRNRTWQDLADPVDIEMAMEAQRRMLTGEVDEAALYAGLRLPDGKVVPVEARCRMLRDQQRRPTWVVAELFAVD
jgi:PAS domain S-box-containing protein